MDCSQDTDDIGDDVKARQATDDIGDDVKARRRSRRQLDGHR